MPGRARNAGRLRPVSGSGRGGGRRNEGISRRSGSTPSFMRHTITGVSSPLSAPARRYTRHRPRSRANGVMRTSALVTQPGRTRRSRKVSSPPRARITARPRYTRYLAERRKPPAMPTNHTAPINVSSQERPTGSIRWASRSTPMRPCMAAAHIRFSSAAASWSLRCTLTKASRPVTRPLAVSSTRYSRPARVGTYSGRSSRRGISVSASSWAARRGSHKLRLFGFGPLRRGYRVIWAAPNRRLTGFSRISRLAISSGRRRRVRRAASPRQITRLPCSSFHPAGSHRSTAAAARASSSAPSCQRAARKAARSKARSALRRGSRHTASQRRISCTE